ncbi:hypothetical protein [Sphingopyxis indica]|uniref:PRC-barrel domain-containing protein n=1 Tax=Sphingopyxis indica TaxID=436663 RepID=A0A239FJN6_9SPHN|nr:hypothetical protein [Sphingopyxis indica]SNS56274.1 hypothetical protein SAMN06295955_10280 [Sphingopyxis indica]
MANHIFTSTMVLAASALAFSAPASAQLLGGGGGLTGGLGGTLGGTLGHPAGPIGGTLGSAGELAGSGRGEAHVDRRAGRVQGKGSGDASGSGSAVGGSDLIGNAIGGSAEGSGRAQGGGSLDAQLIGTDHVRQAGSSAAGTAKGAASTATGTASGALGGVRDQAGGAPSGAAGAANGAGSAAGNFEGSLGGLAAAGTGAANGAGMFAVEPGMAVTDARGKVIGHVQAVRQTGRGLVQSVTVKAGDRFATLPATSFTGSGDVLVTGMTRGELRKTAKQQEEASAEPRPQRKGQPAPESAAARGNAAERRGAHAD